MVDHGNPQLRPAKQAGFGFGIGSHSLVIIQMIPRQIRKHRTIDCTTRHALLGDANRTGLYGTGRSTVSHEICKQMRILGRIRCRKPGLDHRLRITRPQRANYRATPGHALCQPLGNRGLAIRARHRQNAQPCARVTINLLRNRTDQRMQPFDHNNRGAAKFAHTQRQISSPEHRARAIRQGVAHIGCPQSGIVDLRHIQIASAHMAAIRADAARAQALRQQPAQHIFTRGKWRH